MLCIYVQLLLCVLCLLCLSAAQLLSFQLSLALLWLTECIAKQIRLADFIRDTLVDACFVRHAALCDDSEWLLLCL